jgi:hypothetical protein
VLTAIYRLITLKGLPNIKACAFVRTVHIANDDVVNPFAPWYLGPPDCASDRKWERAAELAIGKRRREIEDRPDLEISLMVIYNRERAGASPHELAITQAGWDRGRFDWFG